jgi:UDPglucose 6-dehydrogenase
MADKVINAAGGSVAGKRITMLGVTFKPNTDDMREAPALDVVPILRDAGATLVFCDPQGRKEGADILGPGEWIVEPYAAARGADILVLMTEWNEFRALDLNRLYQQMAGNVLVDLRNVYVPEDARDVGFAYTSIGRP